MSTDLAPKPDAQTGEPRSPAPPLVMGASKEPTKTTSGYGHPPQGKGPVLEARGSQRVYVLGAAVVLMTVMVVAARSIWGDWSWAGNPAVWCAVAAVGLMTVARDWNNTELVAGADWLRVGRRKWVDTYDLRQIRLTGVLRGWTLHLTDASGRHVSTFVVNIETNRELWGLVYNGLVHSVHHGARVNNLAAGILRLRPGFEALRAEARRPKIPDRTVWTFLLVLVAVVGAVYLFRPELLGPVLGVFAGLIVLGMVVIVIVVMVVRRRDREIDALTPDDFDQDEA